jgi:gluconokinase
MIVVVMGVAGSGKTTVGSMLAEALRCSFLDADTLHPARNADKIARGVPLSDADRLPWLSAIHDRVTDAFRRGETLVVACSALKQSYRAVLAGDIPVIWVYLRGSQRLIAQRLEGRTGHFAGPRILSSQFAALEEPADAIVVEVSQPPADIVARIVERLY